MIFRFIIIAAFAFFIFSLIRKYMFGSLKKKLYARMEKRFSGQKMILMDFSANFYGQLSKGNMQIRGNGALILTGAELWFGLAIPEREISILLHHIKRIELRKSHLGKRSFRPLLYIEFLSGLDSDSVAWAVRDPEKWKNAIERIKFR